MKKLLTLIVCVGCMVTAMANVKEIKGQVINVIDGNTLTVKSVENETYKVVLFGIDCPELGQSYGEKARKCLEKLTLKKNVNVQFIGKDRFGNNMAIVITDGNLDPRFRLLEEGLAWVSEEEPVADFESYRATAQEKGKGLWKEKQPVAPWVFRKEQSLTEPKQSS